MNYENSKIRLSIVLQLLGLLVISFLTFLMSKNLIQKSMAAGATYTITFNANGGSGAPSAQTVKYNGTLPTISVKPKKPGYTFKGWYDSVSGGIQYYNASNVAVKKYDKTSNVTLYARWKAKSYTITFDANGGSEAPSAQTVKYNGTLPTISVKPKRPGYTFKGWYDSVSGGIQYYNASNVAVKKYDKTSNVTLYARWKAKSYTITFNANRGSKAPSAQTVKYNGTLPTINVIPTREGYTFIGWYDSVSGGIQYYNASNVAMKKYDKKSNITLYARWKILYKKQIEKSYTITFNANGGSKAPSSQTVTYNGTLPTISVKPTREGYTFIGWYDSVSGGTQYYNSSNVAVKKYDKTSNITLHAVWKAKSYTITFNANGGSGTPSSQTVTYNGTLPTISVKPTKTGYTFMGWYDSVSGGTQYYNASNVAVKKYDKKSNVTLYAVWKINELKIMYNGNGGKWNSNNTDLTSNKNGDVVYKTNSTKYVKTVYYGDKNIDLANYDNAKFISFKKDGYIAPSGSEWKVGSKTFADNKKLKATDLATAGGCDLSKRNCSITLKINWKKDSWNINRDYGKGTWVYHDSNSKELKKYYSTTMPFAEYVPSKAVSSGDKLPLIIFLHGKGNIRYEIEDGNLKEHCPSSYCLLNSNFVVITKNWKKTKLKNIPAIMMAPHLQYPGWGNTLSVNTIRAMVKYAKDKYNIDENKVVLIGHSHGGNGVPSVFSTNKKLFSALVIMSGSNPTPISSDVSALKKIPLKGYTENNVLVMNDMKSYFNSLGRIKDLTIYKNTTHSEVPKKSLTEDKNGDKISDLIYWALSQTKK